MTVETDVDRNRDRASMIEAIVPADRQREDVVLAIVGVAGFVAAWAVAARSITPAYMLPSPLAATRALVGLFLRTSPFSLPFLGETRVPIGLAKLLESLTHYVPGLVAGATVGIGFGITMALFPRVDSLLSPVVRLLRPVPPLAWMAFAIVWFGIHHAGAAFIVFIGALWINFYGAYSGVTDVPERLPEIAESLGVDSSLEMIRRVVVPSAAPQIITSFRTSVGRCWMILVGAELFGAPGLGFEIINAANNLAMDVSVAYMMIVSAAFLVMDASVRALERRALAWR